MTTEERLTRLECQLKQTRRTLAALLVAGLACLCIAQKKTGVPDVITAKMFMAVNDKGDVRASLGVNKDGSGDVTLLDRKGKPRASLGMATDGSPSLMLDDDKGNTRASLGMATDGSPRLLLYDANDKYRAYLSVGKDGSPLLRLDDDKGNPLFKAP